MDEKKVMEWGSVLGVILIQWWVYSETGMFFIELFQ